MPRVPNQQDASIRVTNVGSECAQSDARFAIDLLRDAMGADVVQTATTTAVGPPRLRSSSVSAAHASSLASSPSLPASTLSILSPPSVPGTDSNQSHSDSHSLTLEASLPPPPLRAFDLDFGALTDLFLTAACLAAVADGTSRIRGVANQRVKECDRIAACVRELRRLVRHSTMHHCRIIFCCFGSDILYSIIAVMYLAFSRFRI